MPVIVSRLNVTEEFITNQKNGLFAESENVNDLAGKIIYFINNRAEFDSAEISRQANSHFNYSRISKLFYDWYSEVLDKCGRS